MAMCSYNNDGRRRRDPKSCSHHCAPSILTCLKIFAIVSLIGVSAEISFEDGSRSLIINGDSVAPSNNQFFVRSWPDSVVETADVLCGASLIHSDMILTVAHCHGGFNYGAMTYDPYSGQFNRYKAVDLQIPYTKYYKNLNNINYDVMIMRLSSPITDVEPVFLNADPDFPLPRKNSDESETSILEGLGVGLTETGFVSRGLDVGLFKAITNSQCKKRLGNVNIDFSEDVMCADPSTDDSICAGDSGGPLTARIRAPGSSPWDDTPSKPVQVGVISFGNDCEVDRIPDGFARISYFHDWISKQICNYSRDPPKDCFGYFQSEEYMEFKASQNPSAPLWPGKARITMEFQHDYLAEQTVFVFRNTLTNDIEYVGPHYVPERGEFVVSTFLLSVPGNYGIEIRDTGGDGLTNPDYVNRDLPQGSWKISAEYSNGARLESLASGDFAFESLQTKFIMLPRRLPDPTTFPTDTASPTDTPVPMSTMSESTEDWGRASDFGIESSSSLSKRITSVLVVLSLGLTSISW